LGPAAVAAVALLAPAEAATETVVAAATEILVSRVAHEIAVTSCSSTSELERSSFGVTTEIGCETLLNQQSVRGTGCGVWDCLLGLSNACLKYLPLLLSLLQQHILALQHFPSLLEECLQILFVFLPELL